MKIVLVTGGFDPLHSGHINYFNHARALANNTNDLLLVGINSDEWLARKKGKAFMPWAERAEIIGHLDMVDAVVSFDDKDGSSKDAIVQVRQTYPDAEIIFANGGDRTKDNIPEMDLIDSKLDFVFGVGGEDKKNSSSWILEEWKAPKTSRPWGYYRILHTVGRHVKLKELTVEPKMCLSMQRHAKRAEFWFVAEGSASVYTLDMASTDYDLKNFLTVHEHTFINPNEWHMLCNESDVPLKLIEIQFGDDCVEDDIERK